MRRLIGENVVVALGDDDLHGILRRTDLIRFGKYASGSYVWAFKGNVDAGAAFSEHRNLFPIPTNVLSAQPEFQQNPGY